MYQPNEPKAVNQPNEPKAVKAGMAFKTKIWHVDFPNLIRHQKLTLCQNGEMLKLSAKSLWLISDSHFNPGYIGVNQSLF